MEPSPTNWKKYVLIGAGLALGWFLCFFVSGVIWSFTHTKTLGLKDHIINGFAFARMMNILSLVLGGSVGLSALASFSKDKANNFGILGFVIAHFSIVATLWLAAPEFREDPLPDRMIDRVFDLKERLDPLD